MVAGLASLANELAEPAPRLDVNLVGKWERGDRNPGRYYAPRLCLLFDSAPEQLGFMPRPRLLASIRELRTKTIRRRHAVVTTALTTRSLVAAPDAEWSRVTSLISHDEPRRPEDFDRLASQYAAQLDTVLPINLMPQVHTLLRHEQRLTAANNRSSQLLAATCNTAIIAGWLSYNLHNRGDANAFWLLAHDLAREVDSAQLQAYVLGVRSCLYSGVPKRGETWLDASVPIALLDHAITISRGAVSPALRAWLHARRSEEHAVTRNHSLAMHDISTAYSLLGRQAPFGQRNDVPILDAWRDARLARYHGSTMQLLANHDEAIRILRTTLNALDPAFIPQRSMALTDLATVYSTKADPDPDLAASLLSEALDLSQQGGLLEATMRVATARRYLSGWRDRPEVSRLDEQLRLV